MTPTAETEPRRPRVTIELVDYDPRWPDTYEVLAASMRVALGERLVMLEHVGSTSVPGLCAKPIIDMLLVVPDSRREVDYAPALSRLGYVFRRREPDWYEHRLFKREQPAVNLHVFSEGCEEISRMLRFRDRLRSRPADRARYEAVKRALAAREWARVQAYADAKSEIVEWILGQDQGDGDHDG